MAKDGEVFSLKLFLLPSLPSVVYLEGKANVLGASSNLKKCIKKAIDTSKNISKTWDSANLHEKKKIQNLVFPDGIGYDKQNDRVQTFRTNSLFSYIPAITKELAKNKKGENTSISTFSSRVTLDVKSSNFLYEDIYAISAL